MENICETCNKSGEVYCVCDNSLRFCLKDNLFLHKPIERNHESIELSTKSIHCNEKSKKVKSQIISKSNQLIGIIQLI